MKIPNGRTIGKINHPYKKEQWQKKMSCREIKKKGNNNKKKMQGKQIKNKTNKS